MILHKRKQFPVMDRKMTTVTILRQGGQNRNYELTDLISSFFFFKLDF